jgi:hypothetical protein
MASVSGFDDSYLGLERHLRARVERVQTLLLGPLVAMLQRLRLSAHAVSALQILAALTPKSYLVFYPALIVYLLCGVNHLPLALALASLAMAAGGGTALWRLRAVME